MKITNCRLCKGNLSEPKLDLGSTPLANEFLKSTESQDMFPLQVCRCESCGHYQLNESVDPERLFRDYVFVAGTSAVNVEHFKQYALHVIEKFRIKPQSKILDIASNDGTLLKHFQDLDMEVLGIDPAKNIAEIAINAGVPTIAEFFTNDYADEIVSKYGQFDLITANNVFAHVHDLADFAKGVRKVLAPNGVFSFEVSYFADVCDHTLFDTIYHEHSSYHTIKPLFYFFHSHGLKLIDVERISNHGGSIRVYVSRKEDSVHYKDSGQLHELLEQEKNMESKVQALQKDIKELGNKLRIELVALRCKGKSIAIYGTPAKATTLMYALGIQEKWIDFAIDDNPLKQGTFTPGKHIPVYNSKSIIEKKPDVLLVLAWNFADSIIKNNKQFKGKWIVPLPEYREVNGS